MSRTLAAYRALPCPALFGHRGVRGARPENTLAAIAHAADEGADGVEIDVRPCQTGELVVVHDCDLTRITSGRDRRRVSELSLAQLERVELADGIRPPSFAQVLELCTHRKLALNVELKRDVPSRWRAVRALARELESGVGDLAVVVSSFDPLMLGAFALLSPATPTALLIEADSARRHLERVARFFGPAVHPEHRLVTAARLARWHAAGLVVMCWTVNEAADIERLVALGVDGIISDQPALAREAIARGKRHADEPPP